MREIQPQIGDSQSKILSFVGVEKYDFILGFAKALSQLDHRVLVLDLSENGALSEALYDTYENKEQCEKPEILSHQSIDFIPHVEDWSFHGDFYQPYLYRKNEDYEYVLVDHGFNSTNPAILQSTVEFIVLDMQKHNINRIRGFLDHTDVKKCIIVRDIVRCKIKAKDILPTSFLGVDDSIYYIPLNERDLVHRVLIQHTRTIHTEKYSKKMIQLLSDVLIQLEPEVSPKEILRALTVTWREK